MRLTLRTLLAYMDDILEPADHDDLGKKIEASDFATELIHRSRDAVRRLRLGAPAIDAGDDGEDVLEGVSVADANAVAEYLDNTLPPGDVAEFERMCLEPGAQSDMHLAEVASCHHVLTMVLGEPAEIDNNLKQRIYRLPTEADRPEPLSVESFETETSGQKLRIEPAHEGRQTAPPIQPTATPGPQPVAPQAPEVTELPDYLRAATVARSRARRRVFAVGAIAFIAFVTWFVFPTETEPPREIANSNLEDFTGEVVIEEIPEGASGENPEGSEQPGGEAPRFESGAPAADVETPAAESAGDSEAPIFEPEVPGEGSAGQGELDAATEIPVVDAGQDSQIDTTESGETASAAGSTPLGEPELGSNLTDLPTDPVPAVPPVAESSEIISTAEQDKSGESQGPVQLGNYLGNDEILLWLDARENKWVRLPPRSALSSGDALLTLPKFRTHVVLADANLYLSGGTRLEFPLRENKIGSAETEMDFSVVYGRVLLNAGLKGNRLALQLGEEVREFQLESSASLAVEVKRVFVPGSDFAEQSPVEAVWYLTSGNLVWPSAAGGQQTIEAPAVWKTIEGIDGLPESILELPEWIDREPLTDSERRARDTLADELVAGEPVSLRLLELTDKEGLGRRKEVRTLAAEASVYVGTFEPSVKALSDSEQSRTWNVQIETLRQAMARSPLVAEQVREAFVNMRGEAAAADLMEMLAGYSLNDIGETRQARQSGALAKLIEWLESESLDYRVLAIHNLNEITGTSYLEGYRPSGISSRRKIAVKRIWDRFEAGDLLPKL
ncbi:MAG: hypothetical protein MI725_17610 [Pirellulales bacterium]|nr:hypothetical protein [Pirellulales bacterium]